MDLTLYTDGFEGELHTGYYIKELQLVPFIKEMVNKGCIVAGMNIPMEGNLCELYLGVNDTLINHIKTPVDDNKALWMQSWIKCIETINTLCEEEIDPEVLKDKAEFEYEQYLNTK